MMPEIIADDGAQIVAPNVLIVPALPEHVRELKTNLRPEDANEILRFGVTVSRGLWLSYKNAVMRRTALIDGKVAALWGCCGELVGETGVPFLMTSPEVKRISPLKFTRIYQAEVQDMLKLFSRLENWADAAYTSAIRLLEIVGFEIGEPEACGVLGEQYRRFTMET